MRLLNKDNRFSLAGFTDQQILEHRAKLLAREESLKEKNEDATTALILRLGKELYGIELLYIWEVLAFRKFTPVPGLPAMVRGVINYRGSIAPVYDLLSVLTDKAQDPPPEGAYVVLGKHEVNFVVAADSVDPPTKIDLAGLKKSIDGIDDPGYSYVRGVDPSGIVLINSEALLSDQRLIIDLSI